MEFLRNNLAITALMFIVCVSCGSGGGQLISAVPPYIVAELDSDGSSNQSSAFVYVIDTITGSPISKASVFINGTPLTYNGADQTYEGTLSVAPGDNVELRVTANGGTYVAQGTQFVSYPTISQPAAGDTWHVAYNNNAQWSPGDAAGGAVYGIGVLDTGPSGQLVWPTDGYLQTVSIDSTSYTIPKNNLTVGDRIFLAEIAKFVPIPHAEAGSTFIIGGFNYAAVAITDAIHTALSVTPATPSVPKGLKQQFHAIGTFSDNSTQDLTDQVTWSTADYSKASVDATGLAYARGIGSTDVTATLGSVFASTTLTITPAILISLSVTRGQGPNYANGTDLFNGESRPFVAEGIYSDMSRQYLTTTVTWGSSDSEIATASNLAGSQGMVTALSSGSATITAETGGVAGSTMLTVSDWTLGNTGTTNDLHGLAWSGSTFVAMGDVNTVLRSTDGIQWTAQTPGKYGHYFGVEWLGSHFTGTGSGGSISTSPDGETWAQQEYINFISSPFSDVAWSGTQYVVVGGTNIITSADEVNWTTSLTIPQWDLHGVAWSGSMFVIVGDSGLIYTSPDGSAWTQRQSGTAESLWDVIWSGTQYVACGAAGTILTSPDGITWTSQASGISGYLYRLSWSGTQYAAVGWTWVGSSGQGAILTSPDGVTWTQIFGMTKPYLQTLRDVVWMGNRLVAVGYGGTVLVSP
jgi:hypothetical protein